MVNYEAGLLIDALRQTLFSFAPQPLNLSGESSVEHHLEPLRERTSKILSKIDEIQPRVEIFSAISRLNSESKKEGDTIVGDKYEVKQAGVVGPHAHVHDATFSQTQVSSGIDLKKLCEELSRVRTKMQEGVGPAASAEQQAEIGHLASAEIEAKKGNGQGVVEFLKKAGKWTVETATAIGAGLAVEVIKKGL
jgi:hypothetical protein